MLTTIRAPVPVSARSSGNNRDQAMDPRQSLPPSPTASPFMPPSFVLKQQQQVANQQQQKCGEHRLRELVRSESSGNFDENDNNDGEDGPLSMAISLLDQPRKLRLLSSWVESASRTDLQLLGFLIKPRLKTDIVGALPYELSSRILGELDPRSLLRACCVSRRWSALCADDRLWMQLCVREKAAPQHYAELAHRGYSHKLIFRSHYLTQRCWNTGQPRTSTFTSPSAGVITSMQADSEKIIVGLDINGVGAIYVFEAGTGQWIRTLQGHEGGVWCLQFRGNMLVSGGCDRELRVWDLNDGRCISVLRGHTSTIRCLQLVSLPEVPFAAVSGSRDGSLRVWDLEAGRCLHVLSGHSASVRCVAVHGNMAVSGSYDGTARVWDLQSGALKFLLSGHSDKVYSAVFSGKYICSGAMDRTVHVWNPTNGECTAVLQGHEMLVGHLQLEDDILITGGSDGRICIWHLPTLTCKHKIHAHPTAVTSLHYDKHTQRLVTGGDDGVKIWDAASGTLLRTVSENVTSVWRVTSDHRRLVAAVQRNDATIVEMMDFGANDM